MKKLIFRTVVSVLVLVFVITALIVSKKNDTVFGFISEEKNEG